MSASKFEPALVGGSGIRPENGGEVAGEISDSLGTSLKSGMVVQVWNGQPPVSELSEAEWAEFGELIDRSSEVKAVDCATLEWSKEGGKFAVQGRTTHLGLTLFGILSIFGLAVGNGYPVSDTYIPIVGVSCTSLSILVVDKKKQ